MSTPYADFLARKTQLGGDHGFAPTWLPDQLFDFQRHLVEWAVRRGRAAIFADCGLGKSAMQLVWAENVVRHQPPRPDPDPAGRRATDGSGGEEVRGRVRPHLRR